MTGQSPYRVEYHAREVPQTMISCQDLPEPWHVNLQQTSSEPRSRCRGDDSGMQSNITAIDHWPKHRIARK